MAVWTPSGSTASPREDQVAWSREHTFDWQSGRYEQDQPNNGGLSHTPALRVPKEGIRYWNPLDFKKSIFSDPEFQNRVDIETNSDLTANDLVEILSDGEAFPMTLDLASNAKRFFFAQVLTVSCDSTTEPLFKVLEKKAASGVDVRLLLNGNFSWFNDSCRSRLEKAGIHLATGKVHGSYLVTDQGELMIGSENWNHMNFTAPGDQKGDRDQMLFVKGPAATDAVGDFLGLWESMSDWPLTDLKNNRRWFLQQRLNETKLHQRGAENYGAWLKNSRGPQKLCRFVAQRPQEHIENLRTLLNLFIDESKDHIIFSEVGPQFSLKGIEVRPDSILSHLLLRYLPVDEITNGFYGADGELTMAFDESPWAHWLGFLRDWDARRASKARTQRFAVISQWPQYTVWMYFRFLHYKTWVFDDNAFFIGSSNVEDGLLAQNSEAGLLCHDETLKGALDKILVLDMYNSIPLVKK